MVPSALKALEGRQTGVLAGPVGLAAHGGTVEVWWGRAPSSQVPPLAVCWGSRARAQGSMAAAISKTPSTLRSVLLYLVAEGHPPSSHLCDDF